MAARLYDDTQQAVIMPGYRHTPSLNARKALEHPECCKILVSKTSVQHIFVRYVT